MLPFSVKFRRAARTDIALKQAPLILSQEMRGGLSAVGKRLKTASQSRMRKDTNETIKSLKVDVTANKSGTFSVEVFSTLLQAFIDAYGLSVGTRPPWGMRSRLYRWVGRKAKGNYLPSVGEPFRLVGPRRQFGYKPPKRLTRKITKKSRITKLTEPMSRSKRQKAKDNNLRRLAFLVSRAIYNKGIKPTRWNYYALESQKRQIKVDIQNALLRVVNRMNRG